MKELEYLKKYYKGNIDDAIKRLNNGEPVQYIVGNVNFYGNLIEVNKHVLIPRFETEELVEKTLKLISHKQRGLRIVDLGTGSGCIAITLKKALPNSIIDAVDISEQALQVARNNATLNNVEINFYLGDMLEPLKDKYDVIISNPPYLDYNEPVMDIVKNNEPSKALFAKDNGLFYYEEILKNVSAYLNNDYIIAFEIGYQQGLSLLKLCQRYLPSAHVTVEKDLQGKERFVFITRK